MKRRKDLEVKKKRAPDWCSFERLKTD